MISVLMGYEELRQDSGMLLSGVLQFSSEIFIREIDRSMSLLPIMQMIAVKFQTKLGIAEPQQQSTPSIVKIRDVGAACRFATRFEMRVIGLHHS